MTADAFVLVDDFVPETRIAGGAAGEAAADLHPAAAG